MDGPDRRFDETPPQENSRQRWLTRLALVVAAASLAGAGLTALERLFYHPVPQWPMTEPAGTVAPIEPLIAALPAPGRGPASVRTTPGTTAPAGDNADGLSEADRLALFNGFQSWRSRPVSLSPPPSTGLMNSRVVIHYGTGSDPDEAAANRLAALAAPIAGRVQTRVVPDTPSAPTIRYFHPEDGARARALAATLPVSPVGGMWDVRDFSTFRPSPSVGTLEVWIPHVSR